MSDKIYTQTGHEILLYDICKTSAGFWDDIY
jgi:hypothetical protein